MHITGSFEITTQQKWEPELYGVFGIYDGSASMFYRDGSSIWKISTSSGMCERICSFESSIELPLPRYWVAWEQYLLCNRFMGISLTDYKVYRPLSDKLIKIYNQNYIPPAHFEDDSFSFGEYTILHKGECGYSCYQAGKCIWTFKARGYLYTEVYCRGNRIFFGTAGLGGYFYLLDIQTGDLIFCLNTGGTSAITIKDNLCYFLSRKTKEQLICVDLDLGCIHESLKLVGRVTDYSVLYRNEHELFATTFIYCNNQLAVAKLHCITL